MKSDTLFMWGVVLLYAVATVCSCWSKNWPRALYNLAAAVLTFAVIWCSTQEATP